MLLTLDLVRQHGADDEHKAHKEAPAEHELPPAYVVTEPDGHGQRRGIRDEIPAREQRRLVPFEAG